MHLELCFVAFFSTSCISWLAKNLYSFSQVFLSKFETFYWTGIRKEIAVFATELK